MTHPYMPTDPDATQPIPQLHHAPVPHISAPASPSRTGAVLAFVAAALVVLGVFLPWVQVTAPFIGTVTRSGMDGTDGPVFLVLGAVLAGFGVDSWRGRTRPSVLVAAALASLAVLGLVAAEAARISNAAAQARAELTADPDDFGIGAAMADAVHVSAGSGLWALGIAGVLGGVAVWHGVKQRRSQRRR